MFVSVFSFTLLEIFDSNGDIMDLISPTMTSDVSKITSKLLMAAFTIFILYFYYLDNETLGFKDDATGKVNVLFGMDKLSLLND